MHNGNRKSKDNCNCNRKTRDSRNYKIYVGPTIPGVAIQNRVYSETPTGLSEAFEKVPEMQNLMIPISEYAEAERMIDNRKGYVYSAYLKALEYKENKGGN